MIYTVTFNPAIDYVVRLDAPLEVGAVNRAQGEDCVLGGKGINVSGVLAQLRERGTGLCGRGDRRMAGARSGGTGAQDRLCASGKRHDPHQRQDQGRAGD